jgi:hypothetical protein
MRRPASVNELIWHLRCCLFADSAINTSVCLKMKLAPTRAAFASFGACVILRSRFDALCWFELCLLSPSSWQVLGGLLHIRHSARGQYESSVIEAVTFGAEVNSARGGSLAKGGDATLMLTQSHYATQFENCRLLFFTDNDPD